jgi:outer membrane biogenesis lipoprotein LolB
MDAIDKSMIILRRGALVVAAVAALALGGCASTMSSGTPDDAYSASIAPSHAPGTYEAPYQVGAQRDEEEQPAAQEWTAEQKYEYRGGRDPVTGRARTQM